MWYYLLSIYYDQHADIFSSHHLFYVNQLFLSYHFLKISVSSLADVILHFRSTYTLIEWRKCLDKSGYSQTCVKRPISKRPKIGFHRLLPNAGQKFCRMLQREHSAIPSTFIKLPVVIKTFVLPIFEWPLKTGFTVIDNYFFYFSTKTYVVGTQNKHLKENLIETFLLSTQNKCLYCWIRTNLR